MISSCTSVSPSPSSQALITVPSKKSSQKQLHKSLSNAKKLTTSPEDKPKISQTLINSLKTTTISMSNTKGPDPKVVTAISEFNKFPTVTMFEKRKGAGN